MVLKRFLLFYFVIVLSIIINGQTFVNSKDSKDAFTPDKIIQVTAERYQFIPDTITIKKGTKVRLQVKSTDVTHGIAIMELNIHEKLVPGKTINIDFIADELGEYVYFCYIPCGSSHRQMRGKLIVE